MENRFLSFYAKERILSFDEAQQSHLFSNASVVMVDGQEVDNGQWVVRRQILKTAAELKVLKVSCPPTIHPLQCAGGRWVHSGWHMGICPLSLHLSAFVFKEIWPNYSFEFHLQSQPPFPESAAHNSYCDSCNRLAEVWSKEILP